MNIGNTIKMFRTAANLKQSELAEKSGISISYLSLLERNKREPMLPVLVDICNGLGIHLLVFIFAAEMPDDIPFDVSDSLSSWTMAILRELRSVG